MLKPLQCIDPRSVRISSDRAFHLRVEADPSPVWVPTSFPPRGWVMPDDRYSFHMQPAGCTGDCRSPVRRLPRNKIGKTPDQRVHDANHEPLMAPPRGGS